MSDEETTDSGADAEDLDESDDTGGTGAGPETDGTTEPEGGAAGTDDESTAQTETGAVSEAALEDAARALYRGDLVVYPTETVYGLGADALDERAVERVFETKGRDRSEPLSIAVPDVASALKYAAPTERTLAFMREFLPGPVTIVCRRRPTVPDVVTAGRDRVGVRIPDDPTALALLRRVAPLTATSANRSGAGSVRRVDDLDSEVREAVAAVLDAGETPGGESTVVDVAASADGNGDDAIIRAGAEADRVRAWLAEH